MRERHNPDFDSERERRKESREVSKQAKIAIIAALLFGAVEMMRRSLQEEATTTDPVAQTVSKNSVEKAKKELDKAKVLIEHLEEEAVERSEAEQATLDFRQMKISTSSLQEAIRDFSLHEGWLEVSDERERERFANDQEFRDYYQRSVESLIVDIEKDFIHVYIPEEEEWDLTFQIADAEDMGYKDATDVHLLMGEGEFPMFVTSHPEGFDPQGVRYGIYSRVQFDLFRYLEEKQEG